MDDKLPRYSTALTQHWTCRWTIEQSSEFDNQCSLCYPRVSSIVNSHITVQDICSFTHFESKTYQDFNRYHNYADTYV